MLHEPILNFRPQAYPLGDITQFFGENPTLYANCCGMNGHNGVDIVRSHGTPILCVESGKVVEVKDDSGGYGKCVRVLSEYNEWTYGHLSKINVTLGQIVIGGDFIGSMGNTGFVVSGSTPYWKYNPYAGTHLHLGRRPCRPYTGIGSWDLSYPPGDRAVLTAPLGNGYKGSTDFMDLYPSTVPTFKFKKNLYFGLRDSDNVELQKRLGISPTDLNFGPKTFAALVKYQGQHGLPPTGFCGPLTRAKLNGDN